MTVLPAADAARAAAKETSSGASSCSIKTEASLIASMVRAASAGPQVVFAPSTWMIRFWAVRSTLTTAIPEDSPGAVSTRDTSTPKARIPSSNCGPNISSPTRPIMAHRPPIRAAATAWFAPLPPA